MKTADILEATDGRLIQGSPDTSIEAFSIDTRTIKKGDLFIAIKGNRFNGHDFVEEAIQKGAVGVIVSYSPRSTVHGPRFIIQVKDTVRALGDIARYKRMQSNAEVIAITGSNGKTTTKDMIASVLGKKFKVLSTKGTENNNIGLPLTLLRLKDEKFCVLEMGMNHFGEIDYLASIALPQTGLITNIGPCHLQDIGDVEAIFRAKTELLRYMDDGKTLIINGDDPYLSKIKKDSLRIIKFGLQEHNDVRATSISLKEESMNFYINDEYAVQLNLLGRCNIYNALAAITVASLFDIGKETIQEALENFKGVYSRLELKEIDGVKIIDDAYNSNPVSLKGSLEVLKSYRTDGRKILVSGDMLELGRMSQYFHEAIVEMIGSTGIDMLITVGRHSYDTYLAARDRNIVKKDNLWHFEKPDEAGRLLRQITGKGDLVLVKGSRLIMMEKVIRCFTTSSIR